MNPSPARSAIVIHGVGSQTKGQPGRAFAEAIGRALLETKKEPLDISITRETFMVRASAEDAVTAEVFEMRLSSSRKCPVYEYFWADETRSAWPILGRLQAVWQLATGLPRLGFHALEPLHTGNVTFFLFHAF